MPVSCVRGRLDAFPERTLTKPPTPLSSIRAARPWPTWAGGLRPFCRDATRGPLPAGYHPPRISPRTANDERTPHTFDTTPPRTTGTPRRPRSLPAEIAPNGTALGNLGAPRDLLRIGLAHDTARQPPAEQPALGLKNPPSARPPQISAPRECLLPPSRPPATSSDGDPRRLERNSSGTPSLAEPPSR